MALQKELDTKFNITASYWKINSIKIDTLNYSSTVTLAGYVNKEARDSLKEPLSYYNYNWFDSDFPFSISEMNTEGQNPIKISYEKIKTSQLDNEGNETNPFASSIDV